MNDTKREEGKKGRKEERKKGRKEEALPPIIAAMDRRWSALRSGKDMSYVTIRSPLALVLELGMP